MIRRDCILCVGYGVVREWKACKACPQHLRTKVWCNWKCSFQLAFPLPLVPRARAQLPSPTPDVTLSHSRTVGVLCVPPPWLGPSICLARALLGPSFPCGGTQLGRHVGTLQRLPPKPSSKRPPSRCMDVFRGWLPGIAGTWNGLRICVMALLECGFTLNWENEGRPLEGEAKK